MIIQLRLVPGYGENLLRAVAAENDLLKDTTCPQTQCRKLREERDISGLYYLMELEGPTWWLTAERIFNLAWQASDISRQRTIEIVRAQEAEKGGKPQ